MTDVAEFDAHAGRKADELTSESFGFSKMGVLVTNYNTWDQTRRCIAELRHWSGNKLDQILVVDDGSSEPPPEDLKPIATILKLPKNRGYAAAINEGFAKLKSDIVIVLDSDAYPLVDLTNPVRNAFRSNQRLGAVGFHLVDKERSATGACAPEPTLLEFLLGQKLGSLYAKCSAGKAIGAQVLYSCGFAVRMDAFLSVKGFDPSFDFLDADVDFSMRLRRCGWTLGMAETAVAYHEGGGSPQSKVQRVMRHHANRLYLLRKHGMISHEKLVKLCLTMRHLMEIIALEMIVLIKPKRAEELREKLYGRRLLLRTVWNNYAVNSRVADLHRGLSGDVL